MYRRDDTEPFDDEGAVLRVLLDEPTVHLSRDELAREFGWSIARVDDALAELSRAGLVNRHGEFAFPTRAAVRCHEALA